MKKLILILILSTGMFFGCAFTSETREYSKTITEATHKQLAINNGVIEWMVMILEKDIENGNTEIQVRNPNQEEGEPEFVMVPTDEIIQGLKHLQDRNEVLAEAQSVLNESIQEDRGLDPLFKEAKEILSDDETMALISLYLKKALESKLDKEE